MAIALALTDMPDPTLNNFITTASLSGLAARLIDPDFWQAWDPNLTTRITLAAQLSFCLATGILGHRVLNNMPLLTNRLVSSFGARSPESIVFHDLCNEGSFEGAQAAALLQIAFLPWLLRADVTVLLRGDFPRPSALPFLQGEVVNEGVDGAAEPGVPGGGAGKRGEETRWIVSAVPLP